MYTFLHAGPLDESSITGRCRNKQSRRLEESPSVRNWSQSLFCCCNQGSIPTLRGAEDFISSLVFWCLVSWELSWCLQYNTRELGSRDPRELGLVLVFPTDLEEVEEIGCGCVDGDEVF